MQPDETLNLAMRLGFQPFATINGPFPTRLLWQQDSAIWLVMVHLQNIVILKGIKPYRLLGVCEKGELFVRDLNAMQETLEALFPGLHMSLIHQRDLTADMAQRRASEVVFGDQKGTETAECELAQLRQQNAKLQSRMEDIREMEACLGAEMQTDWMLRYGIVAEKTSTQRLIDESLARIKQLQEKIKLAQSLTERYARCASGTAVIFSYHSSLQFASSAREFVTCVRKIIEEITAVHRHHIRQKFNFGRLNIPVEEIRTPYLAWVMEYLGGLNPRELLQHPELNRLRSGIERFFMVFPVRDIPTGGQLRLEKKPVSARVVQNFLRRLERLPAPAVEPQDTPPAGGRTIWLGCLTSDGRVTEHPFMLPVDAMLSVYISGRSGSGKSFAARVIAEGTAAYGIPVLILDPRNQSAGIRLPENRPSVLCLYDDFGIPRSSARGFPFRYIRLSPDQDKLPDPSEITTPCTAISFASLDDRRRCEVFAEILEGVFRQVSGGESDGLRLLVVVEEAHLFTAARMPCHAKQAAKRAEIAIDRICREGRKYGLYIVIVSQSIRDFSHISATIRTNTPTKIFFCNSDIELRYASDYLSDASILTTLPAGTCIVHNSNWGQFTVRIRPPFSLVREVDSVPAEHQQPQLTETERRLLAAVQRHLSSSGKPPTLRQAARLAGISSMRRLLDAVSSLEKAGLVRTQRLRGRGSPRAIIPTGTNPQQTGTNLEQNGTNPEQIGTNGTKSGTKKQAVRHNTSYCNGLRATGAGCIPFCSAFAPQTPIGCHSASSTHPRPEQPSGGRGQ